MLLPVLEVYVVWHPADRAGSAIAQEMFGHFHGTPFTGLIGGAVEVYTRSAGWRAADDVPRPIPLVNEDLPFGLPDARIVVVVPVLGVEFAAAVESDALGWADYARSISAAPSRHPDRVGVFPIVADRRAIDRTILGEIFTHQRIVVEPRDPAGIDTVIRCRDITQAIAQMSGVGRGRIKAFISYTNAGDGNTGISKLVASVRDAIRDTRLSVFFDTNDLQPGQDWAQELRREASTSALLAVRTDMYASREWCQREMLTAKQAGMPVVVIDALQHGEERGSFLMDHVPRIPVRRAPEGWSLADIHRSLGVLVDECLKRALWTIQRTLTEAQDEVEIAWWAPHAPEPATLVAWMAEQRAAGRLRGARPPRILHPDPPLGADEKLVLDQIAELAGLGGPLDVLTPRMLAARGG
jgi:hypothetical protein